MTRVSVSSVHPHFVDENARKRPSACHQGVVLWPRIELWALHLVNGIDATHAVFTGGGCAATQLAIRHTELSAAGRDR